MGGDKEMRGDREIRKRDKKEEIRRRR